MFARSIGQSDSSYYTCHCFLSKVSFVEFGCVDMEITLKNWCSSSMGYFRSIKKIPHYIIKKCNIKILGTIYYHEIVTITLFFLLCYVLSYYSIICFYSAIR